MSVITQGDEYSALMMAVREDRTEVIPLLLEAGANIDLPNKVKCQLMCTRKYKLIKCMQYYILTHEVMV